MEAAVASRATAAPMTTPGQHRGKNQVIRNTHRADTLIHEDTKETDAADCTVCSCFYQSSCSSWAPVVSLQLIPQEALEKHTQRFISYSLPRYILKVYSVVNETAEYNGVFLFLNIWKSAW